ncbi:unnamed protein product [Phytophthora lilii]|uniref:Unnamed protein product n=1 Tax=Phytophthora lilii TaxID=2077276 RepID=A0A9W6WMZ5_9STRA|nr:unnamed protein product [Phytophthora lilii]
MALSRSKKNEVLSRLAIFEESVPRLGISFSIDLFTPKQATGPTRALTNLRRTTSLTLIISVCKMSFTQCFAIVLILLTAQVQGLVEQRMPHPSFLERQLREDNSANPVTSDVLAATTLKDKPTGNISDLAALIDALVASSAIETDAPFSSNWPSTLGGSDGPAENAKSSEDQEFEDIEISFTASPELSSASNKTASSASFDYTPSSSSDLENTVGSDINMEGGEAIPNSLATSPLPFDTIAWIFAVQMLTFIFEMAD